MKRSDLLTIIKNELDQWMENSPSIKELHTIIYICEREGMLPPEVTFGGGENINAWEEE